MSSVRIVVDSRVRLRREELEPEVADAIKGDTTHENPKHAAMRHMRLPTWGEPRYIATWQETREELSVPRGAMGKVRAALREAGQDFEVSDARTTGRVRLKGLIPGHKLELWAHQEHAVQAALAKQNTCIRAPTGCIAGDCVVGINRAGKGSKMKLAHVVKMFNGGSSAGRSWDPRIRTMVRAPFGNGNVQLAPIVAARESGVRPVYEMRLNTGDVVIATADHRVLTPFGWVALEHLLVGDHVMVDGGIPTGVKPKPWYKLFTLREHPFAGRRGVNPTKGGWTVPLHRLVAEARENGLDFGRYVGAVRARRQGLKFLDPKVWVVHHRDENPHNNDPDNLEVITHAEHRDMHYFASVANVTARLVPAVVQSVEYVGERATFDLEVERAGAFVAGGVAVHNSGKTSIGFALAARLGLPTLVIVNSAELHEQWIRRAEQELGLGARHVGVIRGSKRTLMPLTIAMQKTLAVQGVDEELAETFGLVICDEAQLFAAKTFFDVVDPFKAKYRIAISADERRKDRKEFLVHDLFGPPAATIKLEEVEKAGHILDVEVCVVPTDFRADWYGLPPEDEGGDSQKEIDFGRLLEEMAADAARNELGLRPALEEAADGERVLIMAHRREHCRELVAQFVANGQRAGFLIGGQDYRQEFVETREAMLAGKTLVGVGTYQSIGTGVDLPVVGRVVAVTPIASNRQFFGQVRGRVCRAAAGQGKKGARLYYLWDRYVYGTGHLRNLVAWNRTVKVWDEDEGKWVEGRQYLKRT